MQDFEPFERDSEQTMDEIDAIIEEYGEQIMEEEMAPGMLHLPTLLRIDAVHSAVMALFENTNVTVKYELNAPFKSMGYISLEGDIIGFRDKMWFCKLCSLAENVEIYPLKDGKVRLTFGFHGLTESIEEEA